MDRDGAGTDRGGFDSEAVEQGLNLFEQFLLAFAGGKGEGNQKPLAFERAARDSGEQVLIHDPLVQGVLIDDDQAVVALGDEIAVVKLDRGDWQFAAWRKRLWTLDGRLWQVRIGCCEPMAATILAMRI